MSDRDLNIALKIKADVGQGVAAVDSLGQSVDTVGKRAGTTSAALAGVNSKLGEMLAAVSSAVQTLQGIDQRLQAMAASGASLAQVNQEVAQTTKQAADAASVLGESEGEATQRIQAMVAASLNQVRTQQSLAETGAAAARTSQQQAGAADSTAAAIARQNAQMTQSTRALASTTQATRGQSQELLKLLGQIDPTVAALERLDVQEQKLRDFKATGAISAADFDRFNQQIQQQRDGIEKAGTAMHGFSLNTATARRELGYLAKDIATGQYGRFDQSFLTLLSNSGALNALLTPMVLAIGAVVGGMAVLAVAAHQVYAEEEAVNRSIAQTGNYAGLTSSSVNQLATEMAGATGSIRDSRAEVLALASTGTIGRDALHAMALATSTLGELTGANAKEASAEITRLLDGTAAGAARANEQYHFLTQEQYEQIRALEEQGDKQGALRVEAEAFYNSIQPRIQQMTPEVTGLAAAWERLSKAVSGVAETQWDKFKQQASLALGTADLDTRISDLQDRKKNAATDANGNVKSFAGVVNNALGLGFGPQEQAELDKLLALKKLREDLANGQQQSRALEGAAIDAATTTDAIEAQFATQSEQKQATITKIVNAYNARMAAALAKGDQALYDQLQAKQADEITRAEAFYDKKAHSGRSQASIDASAATAQQELVKGLNDQQGALDPVAKAWATYNDAVAKANELADKAKQGSQANVTAINAERDAYVATAKQVRDAAISKAAEEDRAAFEKLRDSLRDVDGVTLGNVRAQITQLNAELARGTINPGEYKSTVELALNQGVKKLPTYQGIDGSVGGPFGELDKLNIQEQQLQQAYAQDLALLNAQHDAKLRSDESFVARENALFQEHAANLTAIDQARTQVMLAGISSSFSQAADAVRQGFGEQSAAYRTAFQLQKAAAIAMAIVNMNLDISQASAKGYPANIPLIAKAIAEGMSILGNLRAASFATGGYTGPGSKYQVAGIVHAGEGVLSQEDIASLGGPAGFHALRAAIQGGALAMPGYADGGYVSPLANAPRLPAPATLRTAANAGTLVVSPVSVTVNADGGAQVSSKQSTSSNGLQDLQLFIKQTVAGDAGPNGLVGRALSQNWQLQRRGNSYG